MAALSTGAVSPQLRAGKARVLASTGAQRLAAFPEIPTARELGYDAELYLWSGLFGPKGLPPHVVKTIREAARQAVQDPEFRGAADKMQMPPAYLDTEEFRAFWDRDAEMLAAAIRRIGKVEVK